MIEQAELNRAFFARYGEPSWAELFGRHGEPSWAFSPKSSSQNQAEPSFSSDPTLIGWLPYMFEVSQAPLTLTVLPHLPSQLGFLLCAAVSVKGAAAMSPSSAHSNDWALKEESWKLRPSFLYTSDIGDQNKLNCTKPTFPSNFLIIFHSSDN